MNDRLPIMEAQHSNDDTYIFVLSHVFEFEAKITIILC